MLPSSPLLSNSSQQLWYITMKHGNQIKDDNDNASLSMYLIEFDQNPWSETWIVTFFAAVLFGCPVVSGNHRSAAFQ
jgi:hypothetical protein